MTIVVQGIATLVFLGFFLTLMEDPWNDYRKGEIRLFELSFATLIFATPTILAIALLWR